MKIHGFGLVFYDSTIKHILPDPEKAGTHGPALCRHRSAKGWVEPPADNSAGQYWCHPCVTELRRLASGERKLTYRKKTAETINKLLFDT